MRLLLDTHVWIWSLMEPGRLGTRVATELRCADNELWLSPVSVWEFLILVEKGRIQLDQAAGPWLDAAFARAPLKEAPVNHAVARQSRELDLAHQDPADRFLAASALVYGLTLVTSDERLLASRHVPVMANH